MKRRVIPSILLTALCLLGSVAWASTRYVNGVSGSDSNTCASPTTACKTIQHAISRAAAADSIIVAPATYVENLTIGKNLNILGFGATTTIIDGGGVATVVTISATTAVTLSGVTIRNGFATSGGGIYNSGTLIVNRSIVSANRSSVSSGTTLGGGIYNAAALTINNSTISGNGARASSFMEFAYGGGIANNGKLTINESTISGNSAGLGTKGNNIGHAYGGGIANFGTLAINNSTLSGNSAIGAIYTAGSSGGGISNGGTLTISNTSISGNSAISGWGGGGFGGGISGTATIQNSIVANSLKGGDCFGTMTSKGYNLSSDSTCNFTGPSDMNNIDPNLGPLQNNGGLTQTMALLPGSPAIDAGNPTGCRDSNGNLLKTDQRGMPRPDKEDTDGCDMGAYERQSD